MFVYIFKIAGFIVCLLLSVLFIVVAARWRKRKLRFLVSGALSISFLVATYLVFRADFTGAETTNREEAAGAFESDFGFQPPASVKEIRVKNYNIYDASAHWMSFTYDPVVIKKIVDHDQPLTIALSGTEKFRELQTSLRKGCENCPGWLQLPDENTDRVFYKKDFLRHSSSEYYLWVNSKLGMAYLQVSYFD